MEYMKNLIEGYREGGVDITQLNSVFFSANDPSNRVEIWDAGRSFSTVYFMDDLMWHYVDWFKDESAARYSVPGVVGKANYILQTNDEYTPSDNHAANNKQSNMVEVIAVVSSAGKHGHRASTWCETKNSDRYIKEYHRACTGKDKWSNPPDEIWVVQGGDFGSGLFGWKKGVRVYPASK